MVQSGKIATGKRTESVEGHPVVLEAGGKFRHHCAMDGVIKTLVHRRPDPPILDTDLVDLRHFLAHVVADAEMVKVAFLV